MLQTPYIGSTHFLNSTRGRYLLGFLWLFIALFCNASFYFAQELPAGVSPISDIENRIEQVENSTALSEGDQTDILALLQRAITRTKAAGEAIKQADRYSEAIGSAHLQLVKLEAASAKFSPTELPKRLASAPLVDLEARVTREEVTLAGLRKRRSQIDAEMTSERAFNIQEALEQSRQEVLENDPAASDVDERERAQRILTAATRYHQLARIEMLEQRLVSRRARLSLLDVERELLEKRIDSASARLVLLNALVTDHRQSDANRTLQEAQETLAFLTEQTSEQTIEETTAMLELGAELVERAMELDELVASHDVIIRENESITREEQRLEQKYTSLTGQLEIEQLESSPEFGAALRKQRDQLAGFKRARKSLIKHEKALTKGRLAQFQVDEKRSAISQFGQMGYFIVNRTDPAATLSLKNETVTQNLLDRRESILDKLSTAYASYIDDLTNLTVKSRALLKKSNQFAEFLDQQLLWMPSTHAISVDTLVALGTSAMKVLNPISPYVIVQNALERVMRHPFIVLLAGTLFFLLLWWRSHMIDFLTAMKSRVGKVNKDKLSLTLRAILITLLLAVPAPLIVLSLAVILDRADALSDALAGALIYGVVAYLILEFCMQTVRVDGLAELHFRWKPATINALKRNLPWFMAFFIPAIVLNLFIEAQGSAVVRDSVGRIAFVAATLLLATFAYRVLDPQRGIWQVSRENADNINDWKIRYLAFPLVVLLPLFVAGLSVYGYHYTAVQLDGHLLNSLAVVLAGILIFFLAQRAIAINERRLALERVRAKRVAALAKSEDREAAEAAGEGLPTKLDLQEIDLQTISTQTRELLRVIVTIGVALVLWNVWSGLLPAFKPLADVKLWGVIESVDGISVTTAITLWELFLALVIAVVTFLSAKNIPSLLEVSLLSRMSLQTGTSYAITTIARYFIITTGVIIVLQMLGAQWSKLQWLFAALSVGLGFGLQEIVANFVSGIVILFERPIRIGDTVTVGDQLGTVSRIRIRATTIVDWDRRELIIPNKIFITEQLINWTLTDPITRTTVRVGVAYGSDVDLTEKLLLEIANAHPKVLVEPPPAAVFFKFGDSSLDFELRMFVKGIRELIHVTHDINVAIDREFGVHGIEIAFPQRDLHFDSKPIEVQLVESGRKGDEE